MLETSIFGAKQFCFSAAVRPEDKSCGGAAPKSHLFFDANTIDIVTFAIMGMEFCDDVKRKSLGAGRSIRASGENEMDDIVR